MTDRTWTLPPQSVGGTCVVPPGHGGRSPQVTRPRSWARAHPRLLDGAVAAVLFVYTLPQLRAAIPAWFPAEAGVVLAALLCAPYLWSRRRPLVAFGLAIAAFGLQLLLGVGFLPSMAMLLLVLYRVAARQGRRVSVAAATGVAAAVSAAVVRWNNPDFAIPELVSTLVLVVSVWIWGSMIGLRRAYVAAVEDRAARLEREHENVARIVVATERARIARELHDVVSHGLSAVIVMASGAAAQVRSDPDRAEQAMRTVERTGREAMTEMRRMLDVLRDGESGSTSPQPGVDQLDGLVETARAAGIATELTTRGTDRELPAGVDLAVFRIVQEAVTNAQRHAGPELTRIEVTVRVDEDGVEVRVVDNGCGAAAGGLRGGAAGGHGLVGMRERVTACGGQLRAGPCTGRGFEVAASLPLGTPA